MHAIIFIFLTANGFSPGGSGTAIRHNTQITHIIQNNTTIKRNTVHRIHGFFRKKVKIGANDP
jgi:hypothetical protein